MEMGIKVKTPGIRIIKVEIKETIEGKVMLIMAVITAAAAEMRMLMAHRHLNAE
jgi:hypothetical protein